MKLLIATLFVFVATVAFAQKYKLTVKLTDVDNSKGVIQLGLYNNKGDFLDESKQYKKIIIRAKAPTVSYTFEDLPAGTYALAVYHDENADKKCNKNAIGIPTEEYGFSNNVRPVLSPPSFEKAKFVVNKDKTIVIELDD